MQSVLSNQTWKNKIIALLVVFSVLLGFFLYLLFEGINIISATQTFTAVNAQWTQSQKNAVNDLYIYVRTQDEKDFHKFQNRIDQVHAIRSAIDELRTKNPDVAFVSKGLSALEVSDVMINNMASVGRYLGSLEHFTASKAMWEECGEKIDVIEEAAYTLQHRFRQDKSSEQELAAELEWIRKIDTSLTVEAQNILIQLGKSSEWLRSRVQAVVGLAVFVLILFALWIAFYWYKMTGQLASTLKERNHLAKFPELNPVPVVEVDFNGIVTYRNPATAASFPDMTSLRHPFLKEVEACLYMLDREIPQTMHKEVKIGERYYEQIIHRVDEKEVFHVYALDVTARKKYEQEINRSLKEKEILLAEIHHRVKNNLAVVAGLLEMETANGSDDRLVQALRRSISRIHSIALVHEKLYEFKDFLHVNVRSYMEQLTRMIADTYSSPDKMITLHCHIEEISLNVNQSIPLAILVNEVLVNAYKHAFHGLETGEIHISLFKSGDDGIRLTIEDNGAGLPENFNVSESSSLGMTLVRTLAAQLKAEISFELTEKSGTVFQMEFQPSEAKGSTSAHTTVSMLS
ncbi:MAG: sensor histidine kinase [Balneolales bacterium]